MTTRTLRVLSVASALALTMVPNAGAFTLGAAGLQGWATDKLVFHLNPSGCGASEATVRQAIQDALDVWNHVPNSRLEIELGADTATTVAQASGGTATDWPQIFCDTNFNTTTGQTGDNGVVGIGQFAAQAGTIMRGYLLLNADTTNSPNNNVTQMATTKVSIIAAHEIGHVLGLGHSGSPAALMYFDASAKTSLRLSQDDMDGIAYLYPRSEPKDGVLGCGTVAPIGGAGPGSGAAALLFAFWFVAVPFAATRRRSART